MYHRSISEKKTNSFATIISTPEPGKQSFDLQAAVQFIPCSCHELHGAVWASLSRLQLINWLQQLARVPRVTRGSIIDIPSISCTHQSCFPTPLPSSCLAQSLCETRVQDFPFLPHLLPSGISCGHNSHGGNADKGHLRGKCWSGERDLDREGSRAGSFPEIPWWNKLTQCFPFVFSPQEHLPVPDRENRPTPQSPGRALLYFLIACVWFEPAQQHCWGSSSEHKPLQAAQNSPNLQAKLDPHAVSTQSSGMGVESSAVIPWAAWGTHLAELPGCWGHWRWQILGCVTASSAQRHLWLVKLHL